MRHPVRLDDDHKYWIPGTSPLLEKNVPGFSEICHDLSIIPENKFYTEEGRNRGIALHLYLQFMVRGGNPAPPDPRIADKVIGIQKFIRDTNFKIVGGEEPMYDPATGVACSPDLWGFIGSWAFVIDLKSGAKQPYHTRQTACQQVCLNANGFRAQRRASLYLKNKFYRLEQHENHGDRDVWLSDVARYHAKHKETK